MKLVLDKVTLGRDCWSLSAQGEFQEGIHLVSGDTGSGKTTLALLLAGLLPSTSGSVKYHHIHSKMVSFQFPEYHVTGATVYDECLSWGVNPESFLKETNLSRKRDLSPMRLSRGELKRLHLACVLERQSDLLILDEPFSSLDCCEKERVCRVISSRNNGITIIFTHEQMQFPHVDCIWEIGNGSLWYRGILPNALTTWDHAPRILKQLIAKGKIPNNITPEDLREAACRT